MSDFKPVATLEEANALHMRWRTGDKSVLLCSGCTRILAYRAAAGKYGGRCPPNEPSCVPRDVRDSGTAPRFQAGVPRVYSTMDAMEAAWAARLRGVDGSDR